MFVSVSREAGECHRQAEKCADLARIQSDPGRRREYLEMHRRWLTLARSYEFTNDLIHQSKKRRGAHRRRAVLADP
jgi:hypothetical protein